MNIVAEKTRHSLAALLAGLLLLPVSAMADSGFYIGGSVGNAAVEVSELDFDEDDNAYKAFLGYRFDLPVVFLAVEGGYVDMGEPERVGVAADIVEPTGINLFGIAGVETGPMDLYLKAGLISWEADFAGDAFGSGSEDGSDPAYGLGLSFGLGPVEIRGEYERYDIEDGDVDVSMISVGFSYLFD